MPHLTREQPRVHRPGRTTPRLLTAVIVAGALATGSAAPSLAGTAERSEPPTPAATSPFTGLPAEPAPALAVKMDNHRDARPHTGLENADLVGVEKVEGGLSRLIGVYSGTFPESVGPVRSAREYNVEQLRMFQRPALAYSGAREAVVDLINKSPLYGVSHEEVPDPFFRGGDNEPPHNLYADPEKVLAEAPHASLADDIGFRFGDEPPEGGEPAAEYGVDYGSAQVAFAWSAEEDRWLASFDGEPAETTGGEQLGGKTVVVQKTDMPPDSSGKTPYIETVGSGEATVLRDGMAYETTWERKDAEADTTFTLPDGERMPFDRGQVWLVYEER